MAAICSISVSPARARLLSLHPPLCALKSSSFCSRPSSRMSGSIRDNCSVVLRSAGICFSAHPPHPSFVSSPVGDTADESEWSPERREAVLRGGDQVSSILQEMLKLLEDMEMDEESEPVALELVAHGVIGRRVDEMDPGFMMALDYMIQLAIKDGDEQRKSLMEVIKQTVLDHLTKRCPPHVQVVGLLCQTAKKESRQELLRRVAAGGGVFKSDKSLTVQLPGANLNDIGNQADDLIETMESRPTIPDRKLLARLVLVREEARNMMGGGILDERNSNGLTTLPVPEVNFLSKLVSLRPGKSVENMIKDVMLGKKEGADKGNGDDNKEKQQNPVRPGMFLETVTKVLGGIYAGSVSGITAQHLEWVHQKTLQVLQEMAY